MVDLSKFKQLGISDNILNALAKKGFEEPTPIQEMVIPRLLKEDQDLIGQAQTGTGKTAAFGIPIIEKIDDKNKSIQAIILTPTRELAIQVSEELYSLKGRKRLYILPVYGGQSMERQLNQLKKGVHIVVGTPGRVLDHLRRGSLNLEHIRFFILDEADEMLNMGFIDDVGEILSRAPQEKQILLFSATMPREIMNLARKYLKNYEKIVVPSEQLTVDLTEQIYYEVREADKFEALCRILDMETDFYGLIFCRTKVDVDQLSNHLMERGYDAEALHGDISQHQRERILKKFKDRKVTIMVATDVAARGIDVTDLTHVINYSLPQNPESYVHRIGRTGRAGKEGTAITFVTPEEYRKLLFIQRIAKTRIKKSQLPDVKELIEYKKQKVFTDVSMTVEKNNLEIYKEMTYKLLNRFEPDELVAALLKIAYREELDPDSYSEIKKVSVDTRGKSRLFIALGRMDDYNPRKLVELIVNETGIDQRRIQDVRVLEKFSFITAPFEDAELILEVFKKKKRGNRPIVSRAKEKQA